MAHFDRDNHQFVYLRVSQDDIDDMRDGESIVVQCPLTGEDIVLATDSAAVECECCGQEIEAEIAPSMGTYNFRRLENGKTLHFATVHTDPDISVFVKMRYEDLH